MIKRYLISILLYITFTLLHGAYGQNVLPDKWITKDGPKFEIWFQNWTEYQRLFIKLYTDTVDVKPSQYATMRDDKAYLYPAEYKRVNIKQMIGNITWKGVPSWEDGILNQLSWRVDRSNPKIKLPVTFKGSAKLEGGRLYLNLNSKDISYDLSLNPIKSY